MFGYTMEFWPSIIKTRGFERICLMLVICWSYESYQFLLFIEMVVWLCSYDMNILLIAVDLSNRYLLNNLETSAKDSSNVISAISFPFLRRVIVIVGSSIISNQQVTGSIIVRHMKSSM